MISSLPLYLEGTGTSMTLNANGITAQVAGLGQSGFNIQGNLSVSGNDSVAGSTIYKVTSLDYHLHPNTYDTLNLNNTQGTVFKIINASTANNTKIRLFGGAPGQVIYITTTTVYTIEIEYGSGWGSETAWNNQSVAGAFINVDGSAWAIMLP
jgi:hypothetical protein